MSGEGARRHGGRFNRRGIPALYTSLSPLTAIREAQPLGRPMQPPFAAYEMDVEPVVDTLDEDQRRALGVNASDLVCPTWEAGMLAGAVPASQALADRLIAAGYAGMRVWSFAAGRVAKISTLCCGGGVHIEDTNNRYGVRRPTKLVMSATEYEYELAAQGS